MPTYSHSRLQTFGDCPQKYKFKYMDEVEKPEEQNVEAFVGKRVHEALEKLYKDLVLEKLNSLDELLDFYRAEWKKNFSPSVRIIREGYTEEHYFKYGEKCIRNYYAQYHPFDQSLTLQTEAHLTFPLDGDGQYKITGYVDRIARRRDGTYEIHDYKTGRSLMTQRQADADRQLGLYQIGLAARWGDVERVELFWHYLGFGQTLRSQRAPEQLVQIRETTREFIGRIERETEFAPRRSALCDWCEYRPMCPLWKHVAVVEGLPPGEFQRDDGVRLADEYAQAHVQAFLLQAKIEALRGKLIEFARQRNVKIVQGTGVRVFVSTTQWEAFPGKQEPARQALEEFLQKIGKWPEVSELDLHELARVLKEEKWPPQLLEDLRKFANEQRSTRVQLRPSDARHEQEN